MTDTQLLDRIKLLLGGDFSNTESVRLAAFLDTAKDEIISWKYSNLDISQRPTEFPEELNQIAVYAVIAGYSQSGAEGQTAHNENGISRSWSFESMISWIHGHIIPFAKVL